MKCNYKNMHRMNREDEKKFVMTNIENTEPSVLADYLFKNKSGVILFDPVKVFKINNTIDAMSKIEENRIREYSVLSIPKVTYVALECETDFVVGKMEVESGLVCICSVQELYQNNPDLLIYLYTHLFTECIIKPFYEGSIKIKENTGLGIYADCAYGTNKKDNFYFINMESLVKMLIHPEKYI